ncbi:MAG: hypothetical protein JST27_05725 [Bacteroidetes bacterium]|nr:hypothetical protein [Bacteroidota bacterium]
MKTSVIFTACAIVVLTLYIFGSCKKNEVAHPIKTIATTSSTTSNAVGGSPGNIKPGNIPLSVCTSYVYVIDQFNFHRPIRLCKKGFWFCQQGHWEIEIDPFGNCNIAPSTNGDGTVTIRAEKSGNNLTIHYPLSLLNIYNSEDLEELSADNDYEIYDGIIIQQGHYPITINQSDITATVTIN